MYLTSDTTSTQLVLRLKSVGFIVRVLFHRYNRFSSIINYFLWIKIFISSKEFFLFNLNSLKEKIIINVTDMLTSLSKIHQMHIVITSFTTKYSNKLIHTAKIKYDQFDIFILQTFQSVEGSFLKCYNFYREMHNTVCE